MRQYQSSQMDIFIILMITLCTITVNLPFFNLGIPILKDLFSVLLLFIPGYALLISIFPVNNINLIKRVLYSFLISICLLFLIVIVENILFRPLIVTGPNLIILLTILTMVILIFAYMQRKRNLNYANNWIGCQKCGGHYKLQNGESLDDFKECQCGGKLKYADDISESINLELQEKELEKKYTGKSLNLPWDLILIFFVTILSVIILFYHDLIETLIITLLALPFLLFLPGYLLMYILFPKKNDVGDIERGFFSFGLSTIITPIIGLLLNATPIGIDLISMYLSLAIFTALMTIIAFIRRWKVAEEDRYNFSFRFLFNKLLKR